MLFQACALDGSRFTNIKTELGIEAPSSAADCDFTRANLRRNDFEGVVVRGSRFDQANLSRARFRGNDLSGCSFRGARLGSAYIGRVTLRETDFTDADLTKCEVDTPL